MITQDEVKKLFIYDEESGLFFHNRTNGRARYKNQVGSISNGYYVIRSNGVLYRAHRLAWLYVKGYMPQKNIDHINGNGLDNRICNLREVDQSQKGANMTSKKKTQSGLKGVRLRKDTNRWSACITVNYKYISLGCYPTKEKAYEAYCNAAKNYFGEYANV